MRILIIGGTRFIGRFVVEELLARGHALTLFHRGEHETERADDVQHIHGDRRALADCRDALLAARPDAVIDVIPMNDADARAVVEIFCGRIARAVHISSQDVYRAWGGVLAGRATDAVPLAEDVPLREELYPYRGKHPDFENYDKILVERTVLRVPGFPATVLRLPIVYGPYDPQAREWQFLKRMLDGREFILMGGGAHWLWTKGFVKDIARAIVLAAESEGAVGEVFNVGEARVVTQAQWARMIGDIVEWRGEVVVVPDEFLPKHLDAFKTCPQHFVADTSKIRRVLGYTESYSPRDALAETIAWRRAHPLPDDPAQFDYAAEDRARAAYCEWKKQ